MRKSLSLLALLFTACLLLSACGNSPETTTVSTTTAITTVSTPPKTTDQLPMITSEEMDALIANGGKLEDLTALLGKDYRDVGSGAFIPEWQLADGTYLHAWISWSNDIQGYEFTAETLWKDYWHLFTLTVQSQNTNPNTEFELSADEIATVVSIWDNGNWEPDITKTGYDYVFVFSDTKLRYSSEVGIFNDPDNNRHLELTEEERMQINSFLK